MSAPRTKHRSFVSSRHLRSRSLIFSIIAGAFWACSSNIELLPLGPDQGEGDDPTDVSIQPEQPGPEPVPSGTGGGDSTGRGEVTDPTRLVQPGGSGSAGASAADMSMSAAGSGGAAGAGMTAMGGAPALPTCADADADGLCDMLDLCPSVADDGSDRDGDGTPDACDKCPELMAQDDSQDIDADGKPDACDACGIGIPLGLQPLFYFPLDEVGASATAVNLGSVRQTGSYVGAVERGLAGVSDPAGRAARFVGSSGGAFSRVVLPNVARFPSTALTATFWIRTNQTGDYSVLSYAITGSSNEFGVIVEDARLRLTLQTSTFEATDVSRAAITDGTWHFVALTWQDTLAQFYFDGEAVGAPVITEAGYELLEGVAVAVEGPLQLSAGGTLVFGQDQDSVDGGYNAAQALVGGLDEVAIYDRVLSPEQIRSIYTATTCGERCDGTDNDGDGKTDEGFLGSSPECAAPSCDAIAESSAFGSGDYFSSANPAVPLSCNFF
jgi:hypothetical protein